MTSRLLAILPGLRRGLLALGLLVVPLAAFAAEKSSAVSFDVPAGDAAVTLKQFAEQSGQAVVYMVDAVRGVQTNAVKGSLAPREALEQLLAGSKLYAVADEKTGALSVTANGKNGLRAAQTDSVRPKNNPIPEEERVVKMESVVVTGSHLKRTDFAGPAPVLTFNKEEIERTGSSSLAEFVRVLPIQAGSVNDFVGNGNVGTGQSNINLRGLGNGATLTLVNGRRFALSGNSRIDGGNVYNLNAIPLAAIERVDVLKDGASAIYGSDAVAGVINIILRRNYVGTEANLNYKNTFETDTSVLSASLVTGFSSDKWNGWIALETYRQNGMVGTDRSFSASADQRPQGGLDHRVVPGYLGTVHALPGQFLPGVFLPNGQPASFAAIPANQNGRGLTPASFNATAGQRDALDRNRFDSMIPERNTVNITSIFEHRLGDSVTLFGQAAYSRTRSFGYLHTAQATLGQVVIPAANPYNPFGVDVRIEKNLSAQFGGTTTGNNYDDFGVILGLRGTAQEKWEWELAYTTARSSTDNPSTPFNVNKGPPNAASTNPTVAFNWFGDPLTTTPNTQDQIAAIKGYTLGSGEGSLSMVDAKVSGPIIELFGNNVQGVVGLEHRKTHYQQAYVSDARLPSSTFQGVIQSQGQQITALFSEISVPLITPETQRAGLHSFELSIAGRHEDLEAYGTTTDPRIGLKWQPTRSLLLRASYGTSFRAPSANEAGSAPSETTRSAADPRRGSEVYSFPTLENGNLGLGPETSENFSAGVVWDSARVKGLSLSIDYYHISYEDKFAYLLPDRAFQYETVFAPHITRAAPSAADTAAGRPGRVTQMTLGYVNLASTTVSGFDFDVRYSWQTALGSFHYSLLGTRTRGFEESVAPGVAAVKRLGDRGYPKKWQGNSSLFWSKDRVTAGMTFRYVHSYTPGSFGVFNPNRKVEALKEFDAQASLQLPWKTRITVGVTNLFDKDPPYYFAPFFFINNFSYDNTVASPRGATYYVNLKKEF